MCENERPGTAGVFPETAETYTNSNPLFDHRSILRVRRKTSIFRRSNLQRL